MPAAANTNDSPLFPVMEAVLGAIETAGPDLPAAAHERFAFDVLLNSLQSLLKTVRERDWAAFASFQSAAIAALKDQ